MSCERREAGGFVITNTHLWCLWIRLMTVHLLKVHWSLWGVDSDLGGGVERRVRGGRRTLSHLPAGFVIDNTHLWCCWI